MRLFCRAAGELGRAEMSGSGERLAVSTDSAQSGGLRVLTVDLEALQAALLGCRDDAIVYTGARAACNSAKLRPSNSQERTCWYAKVIYVLLNCVRCVICAAAVFTPASAAVSSAAVSLNCCCISLPLSAPLLVLLVLLLVLLRCYHTRFYCLSLLSASTITAAATTATATSLWTPLLLRNLQHV